MLYKLSITLHYPGITGLGEQHIVECNGKISISQGRDYKGDNQVVTLNTQDGYRLKIDGKVRGRSFEFRDVTWCGVWYDLGWGVPSTVKEI